MYFLIEDEQMDFLKIMLENGYDQTKHEYFIKAAIKDIEWYDLDFVQVPLLLRDDFRPIINFMSDDVRPPYYKKEEPKLIEYVSEYFVPHPQSQLMMAIEGVYNEEYNDIHKNPLDKKIIQERSQYFLNLLRAGAHPFLNDIKKFTNKDGFVVKKEAFYNPKKPTAKHTLLLGASEFLHVVNIPISGNVSEHEIVLALVRAYIVPWSAVTIDTAVKEKNIVKVLAHNKEKAREMKNQIFQRKLSQ